MESKPKVGATVHTAWSWATAFAAFRSLVRETTSSSYLVTAWLWRTVWNNISWNTVRHFVLKQALLSCCYLLSNNCMTGFKYNEIIALKTRQRHPNTKILSNPGWIFIKIIKDGHLFSSGHKCASRFANYSICPRRLRECGIRWCSLHNHPN